MGTFFRSGTLSWVFFLLFLFPSVSIAQSSVSGSAAVGRWNLTVQTPEGEYPAWLEVKRSGIETLVGYYVGVEGSARPISKIEYSESDNTYSFAIPPQWIAYENDLQFEFKMENDVIKGNTLMDGNTVTWEGVRAPDLVRKEAPKWGKPMNLIDKSLTMWEIPENNRFSIVNGVLVNKEKGGNLISKEKFNDFKVQLEFRYPEGSNSGLYLRGRYEVQIADYHGEASHDQSIGSVYGFIAPTVNAAKKANEWQIMDITLVGRLVTVILNGTEVICNRPIPGTTGGALDSNEGQPGPIMIQGDHGPVEFRKIIVTPSVNN